MVVRPGPVPFDSMVRIGGLQRALLQLDADRALLLRWHGRVEGEDAPLHPNAVEDALSSLLFRDTLEDERVGHFTVARNASPKMYKLADNSTIRQFPYTATWNGSYKGRHPTVRITFFVIRLAGDVVVEFGEVHQRAIAVSVNLMEVR